MKRVILFSLASLLVLGGLLYLLNRKPGTVDVPLSAIDEAFKAAPGAEVMEAYGPLRLLRDFGLTAEDYDEVLYYGQSDTMAVNVFLLIKLKTADQRKTVAAAYDGYLRDMKAAFAGYGPEQVALLEAAERYDNGLYAALLVSPEAAAWRSLITDRTEAR